jgi:hypothetical protein
MSDPCLDGNGSFFLAAEQARFRLPFRAAVAKREAAAALDVEGVLGVFAVGRGDLGFCAGSESDGKISF